MLLLLLCGADGRQSTRLRYLPASHHQTDPISLLALLLALPLLLLEVAPPPTLLLLVLRRRRRCCCWAASDLGCHGCCCCHHRSHQCLACCTAQQQQQQRVAPALLVSPGVGVLGMPLCYRQGVVALHPGTVGAGCCCGGRRLHTGLPNNLQEQTDQKDAQHLMRTLQTAGSAEAGCCCPGRLLHRALPGILQEQPSLPLQEGSGNRHTHSTTTLTSE